jgi:hypothetical protein
VDTVSDPSNCGQCGTVCKAQQQCVLGVCVGVCGQLAFSCVLDAGIGLCCGTACVDVNSDPANCGICGSACLAQGICADGQCTQTQCNVDGADGVNCAVDGGMTGVCCAGACVDLTSNALACSQCGEACPSGASCTQGACTAEDGGLARCASGTSCPQGNGCDPVSGVCALSTCSPADQNSACARGDGGGLGTCCGAICTDATSDLSNCGACGNACGTGNRCLSGHCLITVCRPPDNGSECISDAGYGTCCNSTCANTPSDPANCGFCGLACDAGMSCVNAICQ